MTKILTIKVTNEEIFLTNELSIGLKHTSFNGKRIGFNKDCLFWKAEMVNFKDGVLYLKVVDYNAGKDEFNLFQPKSGFSIFNLEFEKFERDSLEPLLGSYANKDLNELCGIENKAHPPQSNMFSEQLKFLREKKFEGNFFEDPPIKPEIIEEKFIIPFEELEIVDGGVSFKKLLSSKINREVDFFVENSLLKKEFDLIKGWFKKKLKINGIAVTAEIEVFEEKVTVLKVDSRHVSLINGELIEVIKIERVTNLASDNDHSEKDNFLFSIDTIFKEGKKEDHGGNLFYQTENEVLDILLEKNKVRNEKHLLFLANHVQSGKRKIQFTFMPQFGFLFSHIGKINSSYILELLNSNATYIWKFPTVHGEDNHFHLVNEELKKLQILKRLQYRSQADELIFQMVVHTKVGEGEGDITSWKRSLMAALD